MLRGFLLVAVAAVISACSVSVTVPYTPGGISEVSGQIEVSEFAYEPPEGTKPNQLPNTAAGKIFMTEPVSEWVSNAVRRELRLAGISSRGDMLCTLGGAVNEFSLDDLGFDVDYVSDIDYTLYAQDDSMLMERNYHVAFKVAKFLETSVFASISKMVSDSISQLLADPEFVSTVETKCIG